VTWVKVCGLSRRADVAAAVDSGADAVGFVLAESPRRVSPEVARDLSADVTIDRVLVTVDALPEQLMEWVDVTGASGVQPHGLNSTEAGDAALARGLLVLHPVPVRSIIDLDDLAFDRVPLLDTFRSDSHGGTGAQFDWTLLDGIERDFVLAGGLGPDNVADALTRIAPWGVDASSGLESAPGVKDPGLIRRFVTEAKKR
jgi:phosphoribosylanthranilate isomerase